MLIKTAKQKHTLFKMLQLKSTINKSSWRESIVCANTLGVKSVHAQTKFQEANVVPGYQAAQDNWLYRLLVVCRLSVLSRRAGPQMVGIAV